MPIMKLFWKWAYCAGSKVGFVLVGLYILMTLGAVLTGMLYPSNDGLSWVYFIIVTLPWNLLGRSGAVIGVLLNAIILYLIGAGIEFRAKRLHLKR
jgi:hypothetical protein